MNKNIKFCDFVSTEKGASFTVRGYTFTFERYSAYFSDRMLEVTQLTPEQLQAEFLRNPYGIPMKLAFELLVPESREQFNNDLDTFKKSFSDAEVVIVIQALQSTMTNADPIATEDEVGSESDVEKKSTPLKTST